MNSSNLVTSIMNDGFVIIDLLDNNEVTILNALSEKYLSSNQQNFIASSHILSIYDSKKINEILHQIIAPKIAHLFPTLTLLGGTLATKKRGNSILKAHNDWSIVDETKYNSYNLWIPLINTSKTNGTLGMIVGSHLWKHNVRGLNIPNEFESQTNDFLNIGYEPALKAGQAILYNHKLIHYSRPNTTDTPRNVAIIGMKDKEADLLVSFSIDNKTIETYAVSQEDFYNFDIEKIKKENQRLNATSITKTANNWDTIMEIYNQHLPQHFSYLRYERKSILGKILEKFKF